MRTISSLPTIHLELNQNTLNFDHRLLLNSIRVQQILSLPSLCELRLDVQDESLLPNLELGMSLRLSLAQSEVFKGHISAIETRYMPSGTCEVLIRAYDPLQSLQNTQAIQAYRDFDLPDLARELTAPLALSLESHAASPRWQEVFQLGQSHFDLLVELAQSAGLYFNLRSDTLHLFSLAGMGESIPLNLQEDLLEAQFIQNAANHYQALKVHAWNPHRIESYAEEANIEAMPSEHGNGQHYFLNRNAENQQQTQAQAQAAANYYAAQARSFWAIAEGNPNLQAGAIVDLTGVAENLRGRYVLTHIQHQLSEETGYLCEIDSRPPRPLAVRRPESNLSFGVVTAINDPESAGRIKVKLPAYNELETDWLQLLQLGGGIDKGLTLMPDIDDKVLVLFTLGQPEHSVVLGALQGLDSLPDTVIADDKVHRFSLRMRDGQQFYMDSTADSLRLQNKDGSYIELSPRQVRLHASANLFIEAPGHSVVIRGNKVDFQKA